MRGLAEVLSAVPSGPLCEADLVAVRLYAESGSRDEYELRCACFGVEPLPEPPEPPAPSRANIRGACQDMFTPGYGSISLNSVFAPTLTWA